MVMLNHNIRRFREKRCVTKTTQMLAMAFVGKKTKKVELFEKTVHLSVDCVELMQILGRFQVSSEIEI